MFSLLRLPNFPEPFVTSFALPNFSHLRVEIFELLALRVGRHFDRSLFRDQCDLIVSVFDRGAVEHGTDSFTDRHVVCAPIRIEQNAIAIFSAATRARSQNRSDAVLPPKLAGGR